MIVNPAPPEVPLRHLVTCLDGRRIPLNASERAEIPGDFPYWGAGGVLDQVDRPLFSETLVLLGEDGAPFFEPGKDVAHLVREPVWVNNHIHVLRPHSSVDARYLTYSLNAVDYARYISGSTRDKLTQDDMRRISIYVPPLDEQRRIADFLDTETARLDALIRTRLRYEQILAERHASELTRLLDSGANQPSALGRHLVRSPSYGVLKPSYTETGPRIIRILNVRQDGSVDATALEHIDPLQHLEYRRTVLTEGDVCLGVVGTIGRPFVVTRDLAGANVSRAIARLRPRTNLHPVILQAWLRTARFNSWAEQTTNATAQRVLNMGDLAKYPVWLPESAVDVALEVGRIDDWHRGISGQIRLQAARLAERRQALITAAVTDQLDVTTARGEHS